MSSRFLGRDHTNPTNPTSVVLTEDEMSVVVESVGVGEQRSVCEARLPVEEF